MEMEKELAELRAQVLSQQSSPTVPQIKTEPSPALSHMGAPPFDTFMGSEEAVASLMDLASGQEGGSFMKSPNARLLMTKRLGDVVLKQDQVDELFHMYPLLSIADAGPRLTADRYFAYYHPFLPILDRTSPPDDYYQEYKLLFWIMCSVAARRYDGIQGLLERLTPHLNDLLWEEVRVPPQNYLFVKALCLLCTWPFPISSTSTDPTFMLSGLNMHVAMQLGLHRPSHVQDFQKFRAHLMEEQLRDRVRTWASCNAVAQR